MVMKIKILGIDPSMNNLGLANATLDLDTLSIHIDNLSLPQTTSENGKTVRKNSDDIRRARILYEGMVSACEGVSFAIAEVPVGSQSSRAMASYGICCGILAACPIPLIQVTPMEVKLAAIGEKNAAKDEMIEWAMKKYPYANWSMRKSKGVMVPKNENEHLADAIAAIHAGIKTDQFKQMVSMFRGLKAA
jgi:Holliday junction resolvasome RuvABC endonuclease subunit